MQRISRYSYILMVLSCTVLFSVVSCTENSNGAKTTSALPTIALADSLCLRVAVLPIKECGILRYAQESGLADSIGLSMMLVPYKALMDIDTAILSGMAHVYFEDSLRVCRINADSLRPSRLLSVPVKLSLISNKDKDISGFHQLKAKMVGLTRWSQLEKWMNGLSASAGIGESDIYHAQINDIALRSNMLGGGLIDAGILPQPWADSLLGMGHSLLEDTILEGMGFYIAPSVQTDSLRKRQTELLKKVYLEALRKVENLDEQEVEKLPLH